MGNLGSGELLVIFVVALMVLGPNKLPDAARQVGRAVNEIRRISNGFQREMREAMNEPIRAAEEAKKQIVDPFAKTTFIEPFSSAGTGVKQPTGDDGDDPVVPAPATSAPRLRPDTPAPAANDNAGTAAVPADESAANDDDPASATADEPAPGQTSDDQA